MSAWDDASRGPEDFTKDPRWAKIVDEQRWADGLVNPDLAPLRPLPTWPPPLAAIAPCEFCGHAEHDGRRCPVVSDCSCEVGSHPCACSYPDSGNYPILVDDDVLHDLSLPARVYYWRQVGTDIQVRLDRPDTGDRVSDWQLQVCPTGLLTIHLAGPPSEEPPLDPLLEPIETPGPTFVRQADWDEETQTWKAANPDG